MSTLILLMPLFCAAAPPVETLKTPETMLYVRTTPEGAEIILDDQPLGTSPGLFKVPAGARRIVVELDGHEPNGQEVTIKAGQIKRMTFKLEPAPAPVAEEPRRTVGQVVTQLLAALNERDIDKLEALFLPPADTPAGRNRRAYLDDARAEFSDWKRRDVRILVQSVQIKPAADSEDQLLVVEMWPAARVAPMVTVEVVLSIDKDRDMTMLDQMELVRDVQRRMDKMPEVGGTTSAATFAPPWTATRPVRRAAIDALLERNRDVFVAQGYLNEMGSEERWRITARIKGGRDVHYDQVLETIEDRVERFLEERTEGDRSVRAKYTVAGIAGPDEEGWFKQGRRTIEFRITPTKEGGRIAEVNLVRETAKAGLAASAGRADEDLQRRSVARKVTDFPETVDLSTPESACAAYHRASARMDAQAVVDLSWVKIDPAEMERFWERAGPEDLAIYNPAQLEAEIVEVLVYRGRLAAVISRLAFPPGKGRHPYSRRSFGLIDGQWKNLGEDRLPSLEAAVAGFLEKKDRLWEHFREIDAALPAEPARSGRTERKVRRTVPAAVTVTSGGKPVEGATVMFIPRAPDGSPASGQTDAAGRAVLTTTEQGDGVIPGIYGVTISKVVTEQKASGAELRHLVPRRFAEPEASGLTVEVAESANDFRFDLPGVDQPHPATGAAKGGRR